MRFQIICSSDFFSLRKTFGTFGYKSTNKTAWQKSLQLYKILAASVPLEGDTGGVIQKEKINSAPLPALKKIGQRQLMREKSQNSTV